MTFAGIKVPDTALVRDAIDLSRSASEPFLFNHAMRSWLFSVLLSESAERAPDAELLAVATILHDLGLTDRYTAENRFEVDGANAARSFLTGRGISSCTHNGDIKREMDRSDRLRPSRRTRSP
jgi:HD superfamily phosphodiesterase